MQFDLVLRGGHVIDPANGRDGIMEVAIKGDRIARVARGIQDPADQTLALPGRSPSSPTPTPSAPA